MKISPLFFFGDSNLFSLLFFRITAQTGLFFLNHNQFLSSNLFNNTFLIAVSKQAAKLKGLLNLISNYWRVFVIKAGAPVFITGGFSKKKYSQNKPLLCLK